MRKLLLSVVVLLLVVSIADAGIFRGRFARPVRSFAGPALGWASAGGC